jgi:hypothetical protein
MAPHATTQAFILRIAGVPIMQICLENLARRGIAYAHPIDHDVLVEELPKELSVIALNAIRAGELSCYEATARQFWVPRAQLAAVAGFGRRLYDPSHIYFVPPEAMLRVPYTPELVPESPADRSVHQIVTLRTARHAAAYLTALRDAMPPRPYDLHIHRASGGISPLHQLIKTASISAYSSDSGWWVEEGEISNLLPVGENLDDPDRSWFVGPNDRADHKEVERLSADHRRIWPEVYRHNNT